MKYSLFLILLFVGLSISPALAQKTVFGPHAADDSREFLIDGTCDDLWLKLPGSHYPPYAPRFLFRHDSNGLPDMEARYIVDWLLQNDSTYSPAISATLRIEYYGTNLPDPTVNVWAFSSLSSQLNDATILSGMTGSPLFTMTGSNGIIEYTVTSGAFLNTVSSAVQTGHLTLAFGLPAETSLFDNLYRTDSTAFQLTIHFQDSIAIKITNVVDGIVDYDLEPESLVRGDLNQFIGNAADYSQLPAFEPAYVMRDWRVLYQHIAETWFTKFDDASLPCRMKFREWDNNNDLYKVMYLTPEFHGNQTEFQAISDSTVPARHKVKREITHEYDGLSIAFKDPWRVEQTLIGGVPRSQTVIDTYQDQTTPYEPWTDDHSWGVFKSIPFNDALHYGTHYWRYYEYDQNNDSYDRKSDASLVEGDLIHMDEISSGKGVETAPVNGIDVTSIAPAGDPFREYRLEYLDPASAMDFYGVYKAHMLTDKEVQPTRSANQRKIDIDPRGVYHLTYESAGEIWYVNSEDGTNWSQEELVSSYIHGAANPSLTVRDSSIYITYVEDNLVILKRRYKGEWYEYLLDDNSDSNNGAETTPVVAAGGTCYSNQGDIVVVAWDDHEYIAYNMLYLYYDDIFINSSGAFVQKAGDITQNTNHYPVYPTITCHDEQTEFTICWREGTDIACSELHVGGGTCDKQKYLQYCIVDSIPNASLSSDSCVFAPSITHDARNTPVVAYEVSVPSGIYSNRWVNIRAYDRSSQSWNTTMYQIPFYAWTGYSEPISPSLGAHETTVSCGGGSPEPGLRMAFHRNWGGGLRVGVIDCQYSEYDQITNGECFPSVVPYAPNGLLRETFSAPYQVGPFYHALRTTNAYLTKSATQGIKMIRELRISAGNDYALLGLSDLSIRRGNNVLDDVAWHMLPDSLVIGCDGQAHEILYTEPFTLSNGNRIDYRSVVYCSDAQAMPAGVSLSLQMRKASDGSLVHSFSLLLQNLQSDTVMWSNWSRPLTQVPAFPVYLSLGIDGTLPAGAEVTNAKVWLEDQYIPKDASIQTGVESFPNDFVLEPNHPNPFNPSTTISFALGHEGHVRLSVFNAVGQEIAVLVDESRITGRYQEVFNAENLQSGNYICRLVFEGKTQSQNMMLVK